MYETLIAEQNHYWNYIWKYRVKPNGWSDYFHKGPLEIHCQQAAYICNILKAESCLDFGAGMWDFLKELKRLGLKKIAGIEYDHPTAKAVKPKDIEGHFCKVPFPFPYKDKEFDVVYQHNSLCHVIAPWLPNVLEEMCRVGTILMIGQGNYSRYWDGPRETPISDRKPCFKQELENCAEFIAAPLTNTTLWKPKDA